MSGPIQTKIERLVKGRDTHWDRTNKRILDELYKSVFAGITLFVSKVRGGDAAARMEYTSVDIVEHDDLPEGAMLIWGRSIFEAGQTVQDGQGGFIVLTEQQARTLSIPIQVTLPMSKLDDTIEDIAQYLTDEFNQGIERLKQTQREQMAKHIEQQNTLGDQHMESMYSPVSEDDSEPAPELDMDLSDFSEEERFFIENSFKKTGKTIQ